MSSDWQFNCSGVDDDAEPKMTRSEAKEIVKTMKTFKYGNYMYSNAEYKRATEILKR